MPHTAHHVNIRHLREEDERETEPRYRSYFGFALVLIGVALQLAWWPAEESNPTSADTLFHRLLWDHLDNVGLAFIGIGILLMVTSGVTRRSQDIDAAYRFGYDLGYDRGHREGSDEGYKEGYDVGREHPASMTIPPVAPHQVDNEPL